MLPPYPILRSIPISVVESLWRTRQRLSWRCFYLITWNWGMFRFVLALFALISNLCSTISSDDMLYDERDLQKCVDKIELIDYHQVSFFVRCCIFNMPVWRNWRLMEYDLSVTALDMYLALQCLCWTIKACLEIFNKFNAPISIILKRFFLYTSFSSMRL